MSTPLEPTFKEVYEAMNGPNKTRMQVVLGLLVELNRDMSENELKVLRYMMTLALGENPQTY